jgi:toxin secretion/phage lysis holin
METIGAKGFIGLFLSVISFIIGKITALVVVLAFLIALDYLTGVVAGMCQGEKFDTKKALKGAAKKAGYIILLIIGFLGDYVIYYAITEAGIQWGDVWILSIALSFYLIGTEGFSCLKNLVLIGIPVPEFMLRFFGIVKDESGKLVKIPETEKDSDTK